jgi:hypothetical protein
MFQEIIVGIIGTVVGGLILQLILSKTGLSANMPALNISGSCFGKILIFGAAITVAAIMEPSAIFSPTGLAAIIIVGVAFLYTEISK